MQVNVLTRVAHPVNQVMASPRKTAIPGTNESAVLRGSRDHFIQSQFDYTVPRLPETRDLRSHESAMVSTKRTVLAIMSLEAPERSRPIPICADRRRRLDEPTPTADDRLPSRGEPGLRRATVRASSAIQRRPAASIGR